VPSYSNLKYTSQNNDLYSTGFFNKTLRKLSSYGQNWQDQVFKNSQLLGAHENPSMSTDLGSVTDGPSMYDLFTKKVISKILERKSIAYLDRAYFDKRKILRQYSIKEEIKDFINQLADEVMIYNSDNYFCKIKDLPDDFSKPIRDKLHDNFDRLYNLFGFADGITAWNYLRDLLIDGYICFEVVYDNRQKNAIALNKIDPITMVVATDPMSGTIVWVQHPDNPQLRKIILDTHVIYISYSSNNDYAETSYIESLIRPYNQLKLIEQTKILYNINQAAIYKKFIIPTNGLTRVQAEQQIYQLMSEYHEDVQWDDRMGTVSINGSANIPHSKDFWFPSSEGNTPDVEVVSPGGNDLNEDQILNWFSNNLKKSSRLPFSRFDVESGGGSVYGSDSADITRDEIKFKNFVNRIRTVFKEIIMKPLRIQMILDFPELADDNLFNSMLKLEFNSDELFEEWKKLNNLAKRAEIVSTLSTNFVDADGNSYFHHEWLARNIMKLTEKEIEENNKYKLQSATGAGGGSGGGGGDTGGGGTSEAGGGEVGGGEEGGGGEAGGGEVGSQAEGGGQVQAGAGQGGGGQAQGGGGQGGGGQAQGGGGQEPIF